MARTTVAQPTKTTSVRPEYEAWVANREAALRKNVQRMLNWHRKCDRMHNATEGTEEHRLATEAWSKNIRRMPGESCKWGAYDAAHVVARAYGWPRAHNLPTLAVYAGLDPSDLNMVTDGTYVLQADGTYADPRLGR